jgi:CheY-like chemotaxis protein
MCSTAERPITILIVDDNESVRSILRDYIAYLHPACTVVEAENGQAGIEAAQTTHPDLIFLDFNMPVMDGYEMAVVLRKTFATQQIPLVLSTGEDADDPHVSRLRTMCQKTLPKPISFDELESTLRQFTVTQFPVWANRYSIA